MEQTESRDVLLQQILDETDFMTILEFNQTHYSQNQPDFLNNRFLEVSRKNLEKYKNDFSAYTVDRQIFILDEFIQQTEADLERCSTVSSFVSTPTSIQLLSTFKNKTTKHKKIAETLLNSLLDARPLLK